MTRNPLDEWLNDVVEQPKPSKKAVAGGCGLVFFLVTLKLAMLAFAGWAVYMVVMHFVG